MFHVNVCLLMYLNSEWHNTMNECKFILKLMYCLVYLKKPYVCVLYGTFLLLLNLFILSYEL